MKEKVFSQLAIIAGQAGAFIAGLWAGYLLWGNN